MRTDLSSRLLVLLLLSTFVFSLGAVTVAAADNSDDQLVFGYIAYSRDDVWNNYSIEAFEYAAEKKDVKTVVRDPGGDPEKALSALEDLINRGVDGISVFTITPELDATMARKANQAGIPITFENSLPAEGDYDYISTVACEYSRIGYAAGEYISKNYPGSKLFYVMGAQGMGITNRYQEGLNSALEEYGTVELVAKQPTDWGAEESLNVTQNVIQSGKEFDVIFANNEQMASGVARALKDAGMSDEIPIIATGGGPHGVEMIKDGDIEATMSAPVSIQGLVTFKNLWRAVQCGQSADQIAKFVPVPVIPVTADNVDSTISWEVDEQTVEFIGGLDCDNWCECAL